MATKKPFKRLLPLLLLPSACVASERLEMDENLRAGIKSAITKTDLTVVVQEKSAKLLAGTEEDGWIAEQITAEVISVLSGQGVTEKQLLNYIQYTELDSTNTLSQEVVIVSLCKEAETWYGAGVGTYFQLSPEQLAAAKQIAEKHQNQPSSRAFCE